MTRSELQDRRLDAVRAWTSFVEQGDDASRWCAPRSCAAGSAPARRHARRRRGAARRRGRHRGVSGATPRSRWRSSGSRTSCGVPPRTATWSSRSPTPTTRILWTYGGRVMRRKAETVNFVPAGRWDESQRRHQRARPRQPHRRAVDGLQRRALRADRAQLGLLGRAVHDPVTGAQLGVIDLSTTWDRTHPIGLATARVMARLIETAMPSSQRRGTAPRRADARRARAGAVPARHRRGLARRPAAAAQPPPDRDPRPARLHPEGLSLEHLHALVYGDQSVTLSHAQGRGVPPPPRPRRPARLAPLPAD